jgi:putative ABC transport system permease protein
MFRFFNRIRFWTRRWDDDIREELESHRGLRQDALERAGMSPREASNASRRAMGNVTLAREDARAVWIRPQLEHIWQDLRFGLRMFRKDPGFSLVIVLTLTLGIGANTAIFSVVQAVVLRPLPYPQADRLVMLWTENARQSSREEPTSYLTFTDWRAESRGFADMALFRGEPAVILGGEMPERVLSEFVSANIFPLLGVSPVLGRSFTQEEHDRGDPVVVLSHGLWQRRFGGAPDVIGHTLVLDGRVDVVGLRIIGVMPAHFDFPNRDAQFWRPATVPDRERAQERFRFIGRRYGVVGRLRPGVSFREAQAEMTAIGQRLSAAHTTSDQLFPGFGARVMPMLDQLTDARIQSALWILMGAVGVVLLIACVNAANLLLARGAARARELAIRSSLGAGRRRLVRQLLTETAVLTILAGGLGAIVANGGIQMLASVAPVGIYPESSFAYALTDSVPVLSTSAQPGITRLDQTSVDATVLAFTMALSFLTTFLFGLAPAWRMANIDPITTVKQGAFASDARQKVRRRGLLIAIECGLSVLLLAGAGLLIRSFLRLQAVDPGFRPDGVLLVRVSLAPIAQRPTGQSVPGGRRRTFYNELFERLRARPTVQSVGLITDLLVRGSVDGAISVANRPAVPSGATCFAHVSPGFCGTT